MIVTETPKPGGFTDEFYEFIKKTGDSYRAWIVSAPEAISEQAHREFCHCGPPSVLIYTDDAIQKRWQRANNLARALGLGTSDNPLPAAKLHAAILGIARQLVGQDLIHAYKEYGPDGLYTTEAVTARALAQANEDARIMVAPMEGFLNWRD